MLTQEDVDAISASLYNCVTNGEGYKEPLQGNPDKVVEWEDISNLPPKKVEGNTLQQSKDTHKLNTEQYMNKKQIRLTESDLKQIVKESVNKILNEAYGTSPQKDIKIANRYANAPNPEFDANTNLSWTTEDEYNDIAPEIREMAICFSKLHDIIRSLKIGLNKDKNGSSDIRNMRRGIRPIKPKNSNALVGMDNYLYTLDKIVDKGKLVLHKMTDRIIQNMGLNPKDEPSSY